MKKTGAFIICILILFSCSNQKGNTKTIAIMQSKTTLAQAVTKRDYNLVVRLLTTGPNLEWKDAQGRTALMLATYNEDDKIVEVLIKAGADVNAQDDMLNTPFLYAGASGFLHIVKWCLANGADFKVFNRYGGSALIPAAERRHLDVVKLLVKTPGYPIDHINKLGWTALLEAIILGEKSQRQVEIVKALVEGNCAVNIADKDGVTPLTHAKTRSMNEVVKLLTDAGAR